RLRWFVAAYDVCAKVDPVAPVDIEVSGRTEHHAVARCLAVVRVGGRVRPVAEVRFRFDNANDERTVNEVTADQIASDVDRRTLEKRARQPAVLPPKVLHDRTIKPRCGPMSTALDLTSDMLRTTRWVVRLKGAGYLSLGWCCSSDRPQVMQGRNVRPVSFQL